MFELSTFPPSVWLGFVAFVLLALVLDLGVFHRHAHKVGVGEALVWSLIWITLALVFNAGLYFYSGGEKALEYLTGYIIEKSLSVDNLFVFLVIFRYFAVPAHLHHRVLVWGIIGAMVMRFVFIMIGTALLNSFDWIFYVFGAFLLFTGGRLLLEQDEEYDPEKNPVVRLSRRFLPVTPEYHEAKFFVRQGGKLLATPLFLTLLVVETSDVIFAVDSIPAIFAITRDPFIVFSSNMFAILGLRMLYFLLAGMLERFHLLNVGLGLVLMFVGVKMIVAEYYHIPTVISLSVVALLIGGAVLASLILRPHGKDEAEGAGGEDGAAPAGEQSPEQLSTADPADEPAGR